MHKHETPEAMISNELPEVSNADCTEDNAEIKTIASGLTEFQKKALATIATEVRYGLEIRRELDDYYGETVNNGRLYPNLDTLEDFDLLEKSPRNRRSNNYSITPKGKAVLEYEYAWLGKQISGGDSDD